MSVNNVNLQTVIVHKLQSDSSCFISFLNTYAPVCLSVASFVLEDSSYSMFNFLFPYWAYFL